MNIALELHNTPNTCHMSEYFQTAAVLTPAVYMLYTHIVMFSHIKAMEHSPLSKMATQFNGRPPPNSAPTGSATPTSTTNGFRHNFHSNSQLTIGKISHFISYQILQ